MPVYSLEQKQNGDWINVAYSEFGSYARAQIEAQAIAENHNIKWNDLRIRPVDEIPADDLSLCECGFPVTFKLDNNAVYCERCQKEFDRS